MWLVSKKNLRRLAEEPAVAGRQNPRKFNGQRAVAVSDRAPLSMERDDNDFRVRPGRSRDKGAGSARKGQKLAAQVKRAGMRAGYTRTGATGRRPGGTGHRGRGRAAAFGGRRAPGQRRVVIMARVVRHTGARFRAAPIARHIAYLERDGVTRDGRGAAMFDARSETADRDGFAERCEGDRHHFRIIVSPEDAGEMQDLRAFTRELMSDMARDLGTELDWVAVDHWNTDNPHIHVLVRGRAADASDLVIDRDYIKEGMRDRAEQRVTLELGPRTEQEIQRALSREVSAERWTGLDRSLQRMADQGGGIVNLQPMPGEADPGRRTLMLGRAAQLERLGLADRVAPACWTLKPGMETTLRDLAVRNDIIKSMHQAFAGTGRTPDPGGFALHDAAPTDPVLGRLVGRGLRDELTGSAFAVIEGIDGRTHHLKFDDLEMTGDAKPGAIVDLRAWSDARGQARLSLATRSDLPIEAQITASGATWLDRQLVARDPAATGAAFGGEVRDAMAARIDHLAQEGLARRQGQTVVFARNLLETLGRRELGDAAQSIADRTGLQHRPSAPGEYVTGAYRERLNLASGRFAMIDDGLGFQLVPWRPALDSHLGQHVTGTMTPGGGVDWTMGRSRGLGV
jgi:type IV secretory pathway VirD2 relaxase